MPAPYSDNLYSADGVSDDELEDALSPADGYFRASSSSNVTSPVLHTNLTHTNVPYVPNVLVEDPTLREQREGEAKAREAEEERRLNTQSPSPSHARRPSSTHAAEHSFSPTPHTPHSATSRYPRLSTNHNHRRSVDDDIPLFSSESRPVPQQTYTPSSAGPSSQPRTGTRQSHSEAPPAYSPRSPTAPTSPLSPQQGSGYQTFGPPAPSAAMGVPEEQQSLLPTREPQSMGGPPDGQRPSRWQRFRTRCTGGNLRRRIKNVLLTLMIISIFVLIVSSFTIRPTDGHGGDNGNSKKPSDGQDDPDNKSPPGRDDFEWNNSNNCYNNPIKFPMKKISGIDFHPDKSLTIVQTIDKNSQRGGLQPHVSGQIIFRPADTYPPGSIDLEVIMNDEDLDVDLIYVEEIQKYEIITPRKVEWSRQGQMPCIQLRITAWVPQDAYLKSLTTEVVHLDLKVEEGLSLHVNETTYLATTAGGMVFPGKAEDDDKEPYKLESREIVLTTISGDVKGWFPLYDLLQIHSASGDIKVDVQPEPILKSSPKSAVLDIKSVSGDVHVIEPLSEALESSKPAAKFPPRNYVSKLKTSSGQITAEVAFSSEASFTSNSGDLNLRVWPILDVTEMLPMRASLSKPELTTHTESGQTNLEMLSPMWTTLELLGDGHEHGRGDGPEIPWSPPIDDIDFPPIGGKDPYVIIDPHGGDHDDDDDDDEDSDWTFLPSLPSPPSPPSAPPPPNSANGGDPALSGLISKHTSISGDVNLRYPGEWEGTFRAKTISGSQIFKGKGLSTWRRGGSYVRIVEGEKNNGDSRLALESVSGSEYFQVGEV